MWAKALAATISGPLVAECSFRHNPWYSCSKNWFFGGCVRQDFPPAPPPIVRNQTIRGRFCEFITCLGLTAK